MDLKEIYQEKLYSDIVVVVKDEKHTITINTHKIILIHKSPYFKAMMSFKDTDYTEIIVPCARSFLTIVNSFYSNELCYPTDSDVFDNCLNMIYCYDFLLINYDHLIKFLYQYLKKNSTTHNYKKLHEFALLINNKKLNGMIFKILNIIKPGTNKIIPFSQNIFYYDEAFYSLENNKISKLLDNVGLHKLCSVYVLRSGLLFGTLKYDEWINNYLLYDNQLHRINYHELITSSSGKYYIIPTALITVYDKQMQKIRPTLFFGAKSFIIELNKKMRHLLLKDSHKHKFSFKLIKKDKHNSYLVVCQSDNNIINMYDIEENIVLEKMTIKTDHDLRIFDFSTGKLCFFAFSKTSTIGYISLYDFKYIELHTLAFYINKSKLIFDKYLIAMGQNIISSIELETNNLFTIEIPYNIDNYFAECPPFNKINDGANKKIFSKLVWDKCFCIKENDLNVYHIYDTCLNEIDIINL